jgi:ssDNA-specific exonuclease RecJ|tara:strand:+ start:242 stop:658 length:417 start_codon:yes stop_codon:yes gene_type:complete
MLVVQKVKKHFDKRLKADEKEDDILNFDEDTFNALMKQPEEPTDFESFVEEKKPKSVYQLYSCQKSNYLQSISNKKDYLKLRLDRDKFQKKLTKEDMATIVKKGYRQKDIVKTEEDILNGDQPKKALTARHETSKLQP